MKKNSKGILEQIEELERKKDGLLNKRKEEIWNIFKKRMAITIDGQLLEGFLMYSANPGNKTSPILLEMKALVSSGSKGGKLSRSGKSKSVIEGEKESHK